MNQERISPSLEEIKPSIYRLQVYELTIQGKETPDPNDYIQAFGVLPDFVFKANGILSSELNEGSLGLLINSYRDVFKAIKEWIVHFYNTANDSHSTDPQELSCSWKYDYKYYAKESWTLLNLCEEILNRDLLGWKNELESLSSAQLWFSYEFEQLEKTFKTNGILGISSRKTKQSSCDAKIKQIKEDFDSLLSRRFKKASKFQPNQVQIWDSAEDAIRVHAEIIAKQDLEFNSIYTQYIQIQKKKFRDIRSNKNIQSVALETDGFLFVGGKGKRGKAKKHS